MSTGFSFGANTTTPAFGQSAFGTQPSGSITFGTPVSSAVGNTSFGQSASSGFGSTSFSGFGTQAAQQQNPLNQSVGGATGFNFGAPATTNTGFGFGSAPTGTTATPQQPSGFGFGQAVVPQQQSGLGFGAAQQPASTANTTGFGFGAAVPVSAATGFGFGATAGATAPSTSTAGLSGGLSFGASMPATTSTGFGFGTTAPATGTVAQTTFNLGGLTATPSASTGLSFGATAPTSTGLNLGGTTQPVGTGLSFGAATTSTGATGMGSLFGATTTGAAGGLSLGTTPAISQPLGMNFGANTFTTMPSLSLGTATTTTAAGLGTSAFNLGGSSGFGGTMTSLNITKPTTTTAQSVGLGGIAHSSPKSGTTVGKTETLPRDEPLPNELQQTVESFKTFVKQQKAYSSDVARCSVKEFKKVASEIEMVSNLLNEVEKQLQTNRAVAEKVKLDTAKGLQCIEMAQRTFDTPPGLQYENTAPMEYFMNLVDSFEREMHSLKIQIESTDKYVKNLGKPSSLSSEDLAMGMRRLHESFVALAGRLQSVHTQVQAQKDQYLNLRRYMLHDDTNVFEKPIVQADVLNVAINSISYKPPAIASGPTPFSSFMHPSIIQAAVNQSQPQQTSGFAVQTSQPSLFGTTTQPTSSNLFGSAPLNTTFGQQAQPSLFGSNTSNFQLQKPPTGNKRSK